MRRQLDPLDTLARSSLARDEEYDQILDDDFARASHDEETDLTFFPLAHSSYVIPYPFKGDSSLKYTQALDQTITPAELRITESLPLLDLSNRMDVLTALLTYYDYFLACLLCTELIIVTTKPVLVSQAENPPLSLA
nr:hypothetical protein [Tanacetum cinerariifolium]